MESTSWPMIAFLSETDFLDKFPPMWSLVTSSGSLPRMHREHCLWHDLRPPKRELRECSLRSSMPNCLFQSIDSVARIGSDCVTRTVAQRTYCPTTHYIAESHGTLGTHSGQLAGIGVPPPLAHDSSDLRHVQQAPLIIPLSPFCQPKDTRPVTYT